MWYRLGQFILKQRLLLIFLLMIATGIMTYYATQVRLSYEFTRAIPTDNPRYQEYQSFLKKFGGDGNMLVLGFDKNNFFSLNYFNEVGALHESLKINGVTGVLSIPDAVNLRNDREQQQLVPEKYFSFPISHKQPRFIKAGFLQFTFL